MRYEHLDFSLANPASRKSQFPHPELYCVHPAAGGSVCYGALVQPLTGAAENRRHSSQGMGATQRPYSRFMEVCSTYLMRSSRAASGGDADRMGWSWNAAYCPRHYPCRLVAEGRQVPYLIIVDSDDTGEQQHVAQDFEAWADATLRALGDDNSSRPIADRLRALGEANRLPKYVPQTAADLADLEAAFPSHALFSGIAGRTCAVRDSVQLHLRRPGGRHASACRRSDAGLGTGLRFHRDIRRAVRPRQLLDAGPARVIGEAIAAWIERESESRRVSPSEETP